MQQLQYSIIVELGDIDADSKHFGTRRVNATKQQMLQPIITCDDNMLVIDRSDEKLDSNHADHRQVLHPRVPQRVAIPRSDQLGVYSTRRGG